MRDVKGKIYNYVSSLLVLCVFKSRPGFGAALGKKFFVSLLFFSLESPLECIININLNWGRITDLN